ncbi:MAG: hypothetical protein M5U09_29785 [Gammaproteobacteria bacterium]|nr:hypothetical protein [Gammaproteobacteria bacterium]
MFREPNKFERRIGLYGDWRVALVDVIAAYRDWIGQQNLLDSRYARRIERILDTIQTTTSTSPSSPSSRAASPS